MGRGLFIVFEGGDGTGKSTQLALLEESLRLSNVTHLITHEPGDTWLGLRVRHLVLDPESGDISPRAEALLYAADKAQHVHEVVLPALEAGTVVVCDRYVDSMIAYQGAGRALDSSDMESLAKWATDGLVPDLTILLDAKPEIAVGVMKERDRLESEALDFHHRVRQGFLKLAEDAPERYLVLTALTSRGGLAADVRNRLVDFGLDLVEPTELLAEYEAKAARKRQQQ